MNGSRPKDSISPPQTQLVSSNATQMALGYDSCFVSMIVYALDRMIALRKDLRTACQSDLTSRPKRTRELVPTDENPSIRGFLYLNRSKQIH